MREPDPPHTLLQQLVRRRRMSYEKIVVDLNEFAAIKRIDATMSVRHFGRLARNEGRVATQDAAALSGTQRLLEAYFGYSFADLLGSPREPEDLATTDVLDTRRLTTEAARESMQFLSWATLDHVSDPIIDHVLAELRRIAVDYVHRPLLPLFADLEDLRDTAFGLLRHHPHPHQARQLFFVAGTTCTLLAHASQNMGNSAAARTQAETW